METTLAIELIGARLTTWGTRCCRWLLDRPVSNSGRLRQLLEDTAQVHAWPWEVQLEPSPDGLLARTDALVATSDSVVLDRCRRWVNVAREIVSTSVPAARVLALRHDAPQEI